MGQEISYASFNSTDFELFSQKLQSETLLLQKLIKQNAFSSQDMVAGFEIEAWLVDEKLAPCPINEQFLKQFNHPLACEELAKFNIELNSTPVPFSASVFSEMRQQLQATWQSAFRQAQSLQTSTIMIGILPTLKQGDLTLDRMSNRNRYRALNEQVLNSRGKPVYLDITGQDHLKLEHHDVMMESATTSFQIHIQVPLAIAHHFYNASMIASAAMVGICANAPFLFEHQLWADTRIPLFEQAIETGGYAGAVYGPLKRVSFGSGYARSSIMECFIENQEHFPVLLPECMDTEPEEFAHLKLHNGTVWRWNRPLIGFDSNGVPHIRIEHRSPSAGPTVIDSIANTAFFYGLSKNLCDELIHHGPSIPFSQAKDNFYQAAKFGLDAHINWHSGKKYRLYALLENELLERARKGLLSLGVSQNECDEYLDIIRHRGANRQTGSFWQQQFIEKYGKNFQAMTQHYLQHQQSGQPVSEWSL